MKMCCGVPQGSILGPKKTFYIHDMVNIIYKFINIFQFIILIEDTNLFCTSKGIVSLSVTICNELIKLDKLYDFFQKSSQTRFKSVFAIS